jgi:hypothetical protein
MWIGLSQNDADPFRSGSATLEVSIGFVSVAAGSGGVRHSIGTHSLGTGTKSRFCAFFSVKLNFGTRCRCGK